MTHSHIEVSAFKRSEKSWRALVLTFEFNCTVTDRGDKLIAYNRVTAPAVVTHGLQQQRHKKQTKERYQILGSNYTIVLVDGRDCLHVTGVCDTVGALAKIVGEIECRVEISLGVFSVQYHANYEH